MIHGKSPHVPKIKVLYAARETVGKALRDKAMKRAAIMKLLAFRVMIVAGISCCVGLYTGLKGLVIL